MVRIALRGLVFASVLSLALVAAAPLAAAPPSDRYAVTLLASNVPGLAPTTDRTSSTAGAARAA
jgi:hypothetical protein